MLTTELVDLAPRWLRRAADPATIARAIASTVDDLGPGGPLRLEDVRLSWRLRADEQLWRGTIRVTTRPVAGGEPRVTSLLATLDPRAGAAPDGPAGVAGAPFGRPGWSCRLDDLGISLSYEADAHLPDLPWLTDADQALPVLVSMLRTARGELPEIVGCTPEILRYKRGSRCTVGYALETDPPGRPVPNPVVAKTYAARKGAVASEAMTALWSTGLRHGTPVSIAEPLGYDPERRLLLQGPVAGDRTLKSLMLDAFGGDGRADLERLERLVEASAAGLAALHGSGVRVGQPRRWSDDLDELTSRRDRLLGALPELGSYAADLLAALVDLDRSTPPDPDVPTHGSFRAAQVLVAGDRIGFIDFDSFAQAEPALDVAEFVLRLEQLALVKVAAPGSPHPTFDRRAAVDRLTSAFLDEYRRHADVDPERVTLWWTLGALSLLFSSYVKLKLTRLPACDALVTRLATRHDLPLP